MVFHYNVGFDRVYSLEVQDDVKNPIDFIVTFIPFLKETWEWTQTGTV